MTREKLVNNILDCGGEVVFVYNGKNCGIFFTMENRVWNFFLCYGDDSKEFHDLDLVLADKYFDGKSVEDLLDEVEFEFC